MLLGLRVRGRGSLTQLLGRACERALDHFAVGVVPSTHTTLVLLLTGADHSITAYLLHGEGVQCTLEIPSPLGFDLYPKGADICSLDTLSSAQCRGRKWLWSKIDPMCPPEGPPFPSLIHSFDQRDLRGFSAQPKQSAF